MNTQKNEYALFNKCYFETRDIFLTLNIVRVSAGDEEEISTMAAEINTSSNRCYHM